LPRILSNASDAPFLGEAALLFNFSRPVLQRPVALPPMGIPAFAYAVLAGYVAIAALLAVAAGLAWRRWKRGDARCTPHPTFQCGAWAVLAFGGAGCLIASAWTPGLLMLLGAQFLPRSRRLRHEEAATPTAAMRPASPDETANPPG